MSKFGHTKDKILKLLESGKMTPTEISEKTGLSPSTVSQHLQELGSSGAVTYSKDSHFRKVKYYSRNTNSNNGDYKTGNFMEKMTNRTLGYTIAALAILALAYVVISAGFASAVNTVPITLTDPPLVPNGTTSLYINYSSVALHVSGSDNSSGWVTSNNSGTINLLSLVNFSQVIAGVKLQNNSFIDLARFKISSAQIAINGTTYNVSVPNGQITVPLVGKNKVNSTAGVMIDFSPTVAAAYVGNSTVFIMVPAAKAFVVSALGQSNSLSSSKASVSIGARRRLSDNETADVEMNANVSLSNASLVNGANGNIIFSISVKNNGNRSIEINHALVLGREMLAINITRNCTRPTEEFNDSCHCLLPASAWCCCLKRRFQSRRSSTSLILMLMRRLPAISSLLSRGPLYRSSTSLISMLMRRLPET